MVVHPRMFGVCVMLGLYGAALNGCPIPNPYYIESNESILSSTAERKALASANSIAKRLPQSSRALEIWSV